MIEKIRANSNYSSNQSVPDTSFVANTRKIYNLSFPSDYVGDTCKVIVREGSTDNFNPLSSAKISLSFTITTVVQNISIPATETVKCTAGTPHVIDFLVNDGTDDILYCRANLRVLVSNL